MRNLKTLLPALAVTLGLSCSLTTLALAQDDTSTEISVDGQQAAAELAEDDAELMASEIVEEDADAIVDDAEMVEDDAPASGAADAPSIRGLRSEALKAPDTEAAMAAVQRLEALAATDPEAAYALGEVYIAGGVSITKDPARAVPFFEAAAAAGDARAFKRLGDIHRAVDGLQDPLKAYENYKAAADLGDATSAYRTGDYLRAGEVVPRDINAAIAYYELAHAGGNIPSLMRLGDIYRTGAADGLALADAVAWYEKAGEAGNALAYYRLGEIYRVGLGGTPQRDLAVQNYERAVAGGNTAALMRLARGLLNASLAPGRASEGVALLQKAADEGVSGGALYLAQAQLEGTGTPADTQAGLATLTAAAEGGDVAAARYLIQLYTRGQSGVRRDVAAARNVLEKLSATAEPAIAAYEGVIVKTAENAGYAPIGDSFAMLDAEMKRSALNRVYAMDRNAYVYLLQRRLEELGLYSGALNGLMTSSTISAINRLCATHDIVSACRFGPLSSVARRSVAQVVFE
jgi:TPR repeat protein